MRKKKNPIQLSPAKEELGEQPSSEAWQIVDRRPKKKAKKIPKAGNNYPAITFAAKESRLSGQIKIGDLQSLVLYILADGMAPQFVSIRHRPQFRKVVVLTVPGLEESMFGTKPASASRRHSPDEYYPRKLKSETLPENLKLFADMFEYIWPVKTPGDRKFAKMHSPLHAMLTAPVTKSQEKNSNGKGLRQTREPKGWQNSRTPITHFLTSTEDLQENGYTLHPASYNDVIDKNNLAEQRKTWELDEAHGWVDTKVDSFDDGSVPDDEFEQGSLTVGREILAMDCEMCMTGKDEFSLTRISIVGWDGSVVLDELVKPEKPIINYLTQYSGITETMLSSSVTTTLQDVQKKLLEIFHPRTILIGHSLDSDLKALKLTHPYIIDTAVIYPHPRGPPLKSSLKWLAQKYLGKEIQKGHGATGHDSTEDARTCLDLVKLKCEKGSDWGASDSQGENLFKRLARAGVRYKSQGASAIPDLTDGKSSAAIDWGDPKRGPGAAATFSIGCQSDEQIMEGVIRAVNGDSDGKEIPGGGVDFVWGRFRELEDLKGWTNQKLPRAPEIKSAVVEGSAVENESGEKMEVERNVKEPESNSIPENTESKTVTEPKAEEDAKIPSPSQPPSTNDSISSATLALTNRIYKIFNSLPPCTAFILYSGSGDPREMVRYQKMKQQFQHEYKTTKWDQLSVKWTDVEEQAMNRAADEARNGVGFIAVK
ncbi:hypothetical protein DID88_006087 [Monilinia fructigena]|uniref:Exonuclease domain-containing protein n=1 Tax=Monilinia fructigena TaxID=38457 RepID=A0A395J2B3_9HELO|nr:hypothetical protein DID88_006087 [Monilinia fructigena]